MKIFEFRPGSYIDPVSGAVGVNINGEFVRGDKGTVWKTTGVVGTKVLYDKSITFSGDFSAEAWYKTGDKTGDDLQIIGGPSTAFQITRIRNNIFAPYITDRLGNVQSTSSALPGGGEVTDSNWHHYVYVYKRGIGINIYIDGELVQTDDDDLVADVLLSSINIGFSAASDYFVGHIGRTQIYDHALTEKERAKLYKEFLRAAPTSKIIE
jgi:hypothetical protein